MRINEAEMIYFHSKLPVAARGTNSEHLGNVFVFVQDRMQMFREQFLSFTVSKIRTYQKHLATGETSAILSRRYDNCFDLAHLYS